MAEKLEAGDVYELLGRHASKYRHQVLAGFNWAYSVDELDLYLGTEAAVGGALDAGEDTWGFGEDLGIGSYPWKKKS